MISKCSSVVTRPSASEVAISTLRVLKKSMKLLVVHFIIVSTLCLASVQTKSFSSVHGEPRIFFSQMIEASGLFPLEINVPDTLSSMMSGLSSAYSTMSMYFGNGGSEGEGGQSQPEVNSVTRDRKKKVKRKKKKKITENDYDYDFLQYLML